jgi:hypothetical protein
MPLARHTAIVAQGPAHRAQYAMDAPPAWAIRFDEPAVNSGGELNVASCLPDENPDL